MNPDIAALRDALVAGLDRLEVVEEQAGIVRKGPEEEADGAVSKRDFSDKKRQQLAGTGAAMPGGGFPIQNEQDLKNAIQAVGRAKNPDAAKAHIKARAKALGKTGLLPEGW